MIKNHIVRAKPQLIRKRTQIMLPKNVSVIIRPSRTQVINLKDLKKPSPQTPLHKQQIAPPSKENNIVSVVSRQKLLKQRRSTSRKPEIKYITRNTTPESSARIATLRNIGKNKILLIIGNGPSILEVELQKLRNHQKIDILSVNKPDSRIWPTTYWAFFDSSQLRRNEDLWNGYEGTIFNSTAIKKQKQTSMQFKNQGGKGWSRDLIKNIHIGRSSVFASMQIAAWMNYEHVYIFGTDMHPDGIQGVIHFYGVNPDVDPNDRKQRFDKEAVFYDHAASIMTMEERLKFTFCSSYNKHDFVNKFLKLDHKVAVEKILEHAQKL